MSQNILARYGMGHDPYAWRSDMDAPRNMLGPRATMTQGPAPVRLVDLDGTTQTDFPLLDLMMVPPRRSSR